MEHTKNFGFEHKCGVILSVSSLPSPYGIGSFGQAARDFVDFLSGAGQTCWQVLPLNPTSYGDSPYQSPAAMAGNPYFIDLDLLARQGLLTPEELEPHQDMGARVDYSRLFTTRYELLRLAHSRCTPDDGYQTFVAENESWLEDYALFMALKTHYAYRPWTDWAPEHRDHRQARQYKDAFAEELSFWRWCQYEFDLQWQALRAYAHEKGLCIIGDLPIYVAHDSVDVWAAPEQFLLDEQFAPTVVAGCPPDGFSPDGQLWGNPIYNWPLMQSQDFSWWMDRAGNAFRLYDILRIDHFRGFAGYYNVPYGETTARNGKWDAAPGLALFRALQARYPDAKIIAEDLGLITEDVRQLLRDTGFPGMKMLHFAFYDEDSDNHPSMYESANCVVYASSHDSDCSVTWVNNLAGEALVRFDRDCPRNPEQHRVYDLIEYAFHSRANLAMVPMQDYLLLSNEEGRINEPGAPEGNWTWRLTAGYDTPQLQAAVLNLAAQNGRNK